MSFSNGPFCLLIKNDTSQSNYFPLRKPEPKPEPKKAEPAKPQKTWGAAGSKKAEPPKAEPEKKPIQLKKAEPGNKKPEETQKAEMPSLKPTPKQQKGQKDEAKESVQLKSSLKHEVCHLLLIFTSKSLIHVVTRYIGTFKDLFNRSHNPSHSTLYQDVLKVKTIIDVKQIIAKIPFVYYLQISKSIIWQPRCQDIQAAELSEMDLKICK